MTTTKEVFRQDFRCTICGKTVRGAMESTHSTHRSSSREMHLKDKHPEVLQSWLDEVFTPTGYTDAF